MRAALARPVERVGADQPAHRVPVLGFAIQPECVGHVAALGEQLRRARGGGALFVARQPPAHFFQQELAEQRVVVIGGLRAAAAIDEQMAPEQVVEQAGRFFVSGQRDRFGLRDRRRDRGEHQHALVRRLCAVEDLAREILEHGVLALIDPLIQRISERGTRAAEVLAQQHQRCDPTIALRLDTLHVLRIELLRAEDRLRLLRRAAQRDFVDARDAPVGDQPCELGRRIGARDDEQRDAVGNFFQSLRNRSALLGARARLVKVVEHQRERTRQHRTKIAKETAREPCEVLLRLGRKQRLRRALFRKRRGGGAHVVHERGRICVAAVDLVPDVTLVARLEVTRHQGRLAGTRWCAHPDDRPRSRLVQQLEQPWTLERVVELGPREFGEGRRAGGQRELRADRVAAHLNTACLAQYGVLKADRHADKQNILLNAKLESEGRKPLP